MGVPDKGKLAVATVSQAGGQPHHSPGPSVEDAFDFFITANTLKNIMSGFNQICDLVDLNPADEPRTFYRALRAKLWGYWKAQNLFMKLDKRVGHKEYRRQSACQHTRAFVIGAGPCGMRCAIELALLGAKVVVVEKRDRFSRNNILHLWPYLIHDLSALGARKFFPKFCAGAIDHISIRSLQCILLKAGLLFGVQVFPGVSFEGLVEPTAKKDSTGFTGWRAKVDPEGHVVSSYEFDVLIGADGKRNTLEGFKRKEFRGRLAIAITANFVNYRSPAEAQVEEISGVAFIFNQKFFSDLYARTGIDLENIVYYKDETHYFVMTAKKTSLLAKGVLKKDFDDPVCLLNQSNICHEALLAYAREAADVSTQQQLPSLDFALNHYGQPDVAVFDFTSLFAAENASRVLEKFGRQLLMCLVGDSLHEPFWPTGSGCARGFLSALDAAWMARRLAQGNHHILEVIAERESIYQRLSQTTPENMFKDYTKYTIDPRTRYPAVNLEYFQPRQVRHLFSTDDDTFVVPPPRSPVRGRHGRLGSLPQAPISPGLPSPVAMEMERSGTGTINAHRLLRWFQIRLDRYQNRVTVNDLAGSWQSGVAFLCLLHAYLPDQVELSDVTEENALENNRLAFHLFEHALDIPPVMTAEEVLAAPVPDELSMLCYLEQIYQTLRQLKPKREECSTRHRRHSRRPSMDLLEGSGPNSERRPYLRTSALEGVGGPQRHFHHPAFLPATAHGRRKSRGFNGAVEAAWWVERGLANKRREELLTAWDGNSSARKHRKFSAHATSGVDRVSDLSKKLFPTKGDREMEDILPLHQIAKKVEVPDAVAELLGHKRSEFCHFCKRRVYIVERQSAEGYFFHRECFRCAHCSSHLMARSYAFRRASNGEGFFYCFAHADIKPEEKKKENNVSNAREALLSQSKGNNRTERRSQNNASRHEATGAVRGRKQAAGTSRDHHHHRRRRRSSGKRTKAAAAPDGGGAVERLVVAVGDGDSAVEEDEATILAHNGGVRVAREGRAQRGKDREMMDWFGDEEQVDGEDLDDMQRQLELLQDEELEAFFGSAEDESGDDIADDFLWEGATRHTFVEALANCKSFRRSKGQATPGLTTSSTSSSSARSSSRDSFSTSLGEAMDSEGFLSSGSDLENGIGTGSRRPTPIEGVVDIKTVEPPRPGRSFDVEDVRVVNSSLDRPDDDGNTLAQPQGVSHVTLLTSSSVEEGGPTVAGGGRLTGPRRVMHHLAKQKFCFEAPKPVSIDPKEFIAQMNQKNALVEDIPDRTELLEFVPVMDVGMAGFSIADPDPIIPCACVSDTQSGIATTLQSSDYPLTRAQYPWTPRRIPLILPAPTARLEEDNIESLDESDQLNEVFEAAPPSCPSPIPKIILPADADVSSSQPPTNTTFSLFSDIRDIDSFSVNTENSSVSHTEDSPDDVVVDVTRVIPTVTPASRPSSFVAEAVLVGPEMALQVEEIALPLPALPPGAWNMLKTQSATDTPDTPTAREVPVISDSTCPSCGPDTLSPPSGKEELGSGAEDAGILPMMSEIEKIEEAILEKDDSVANLEAAAEPPTAPLEPHLEALSCSLPKEEMARSGSLETRKPSTSSSEIAAAKAARSPLAVEVNFEPEAPVSSGQMWSEDEAYLSSSTGQSSSLDENGSPKKRSKRKPREPGEGESAGEAKRSPRYAAIVEAAASQRRRAEFAEQRRGSGGRTNSSSEVSASADEKQRIKNRLHESIARIKINLQQPNESNSDNEDVNTPQSVTSPTALIVRRRRRQDELARLRKAQAIQRQLDEINFLLRQLEGRGVDTEKRLRAMDTHGKRAEGCSPSSPTEETSPEQARLYEELLQIVGEKNKLVRTEADLTLQAKLLELEDRADRLEEDYRYRMLTDDVTKTAEQKAEDSRILGEYIKVVTERESLSALQEEQQSSDHIPQSSFGPAKLSSLALRFVLQVLPQRVTTDQWPSEEEWSDDALMT